MDRRGWNTARAINVEAVTASSSQYDRCLNSVHLSQGATLLCCGVSAKLGPTSLDAPDDGRLVVSVSFPLIGSSVGGAAIEQAQHVMRYFLEQAIPLLVDVTDLLILRGVACWVVLVDVVVLNADGSLLDAALKCASHALGGVTLPRTTLPGSGVVVQPKPLKTVRKLGSCCTVALLRASTVLLLDPSSAEESVADCLVTVVLEEEGGRVLLFWNHGGLPVAPMVTRRIVQLTMMRAGNLE